MPLEQAIEKTKQKAALPPSIKKEKRNIYSPSRKRKEGYSIEDFEDAEGGIASLSKTATGITMLRALEELPNWLNSLLTKATSEWYILRVRTTTKKGVMQNPTVKTERVKGKELNDAIKYIMKEKNCPHDCEECIDRNEPNERITIDDDIIEKRFFIEAQPQEMKAIELLLKYTHFPVDKMKGDNMSIGQTLQSLKEMTDRMNKK